MPIISQNDIVIFLFVVNEEFLPQIFLTKFLFFSLLHRLSHKVTLYLKKKGNKKIGYYTCHKPNIYSLIFGIIPHNASSTVLKIYKIKTQLIVYHTSTMYMAVCRANETLNETFQIIKDDHHPRLKLMILMKLVIF